LPLLLPLLFAVAVAVAVACLLSQGGHSRVTDDGRSRPPLKPPSRGAAALQRRRALRVPCPCPLLCSCPLSWPLVLTPCGDRTPSFPGSPTTSGRRGRPRRA